MDKTRHLSLSNSSYVAYKHCVGKSPLAVVGLGGFTSEMNGAKAEAIYGYCSSHNIECIVFDYLGHGVSSGDFQDYTLSDWFDNCCQVVEKLTQKPLVLVGTSMGGWLMLHVAMTYPKRVRGLVGLAPSPDFTENLGLNATDLAEAASTGLVTSYAKRVCGFMGLSSVLSEEIAATFDKKKSAEVLNTGTITINKNGRQNTVTLRLLQDAKKFYVLDLESLPITCGTVLVHSVADTVSPYSASVAIAKKIKPANPIVHLIRSGDHLLNDPHPLNIAFSAIDGFIARERGE